MNENLLIGGLKDMLQKCIELLHTQKFLTLHTCSIRLDDKQIFGKKKIDLKQC